MIDRIEISAPFFKQWPPKTHTQIFFENEKKSNEEINVVLETKNSLYRKELKNLNQNNILLGVEDFLQELKEKHYKLAIGSSSKPSSESLSAKGSPSKVWTKSLSFFS